VAQFLTKWDFSSLHQKIVPAVLTEAHVSFRFSLGTDFQFLLSSSKVVESKSFIKFEGIVEGTVAEVQYISSRSNCVG
jgi:hypothetical protein